MSRLSFRPRPLDIHKKIPIVKSFKDFEDDEPPPRSSLLPRLVAEPENEPHKAPTKKVNAQEIPTPQFNIVDTYERDYSRTFNQPNSYIRSRGARAEIGEFVEYDLDDEDDDWLNDFNNERKSIPPEKFEAVLFKLEVLDHKARERAGLITPTFGSPVPVVLQFDAAMEALQSLSMRYSISQSVYNYWKSKREKWAKPILRRLQPPPPVNDTNPYNVFRPREKSHRLHTRRMQRRENNVQSFERLRLVRRNLDQAKTLLEALIKREEKKREAMDCEVNLQRLQITYKNEAQLVEDGMALSGFQQVSSKFGGSSEDDYAADSDDTTAGGRPYSGRDAARLASGGAHHHARAQDARLAVIPPFRIKREQLLKRRPSVAPNGWTLDLDPDEPVLLFTRPLDPDKLSAAGIKQPLLDPPPTGDGQMAAPYRLHGRIGRGGRIIFDRCNPLTRDPIGHTNSPYLACNIRQSPDG